MESHTCTSNQKKGKLVDVVKSCWLHPVVIEGIFQGKCKAEMGGTKRKIVHIVLTQAGLNGSLSPYERE